MPTQCLYSTSSKDAVLEHYNTITVPPGVTESGPPDFTFNAGLVSLSILFLVISYGTRVITIYPPLSQAFDRCLRGAPMNFLEKRYQTAKDKASLPRFKYWNSFYKVLLLTVILIAEAWLEVGVSVFWQVLWLGSAVIWGTLRLAGLRRNMPLSDEASWGFGQILALILCIVPILDFIRRFLEAKDLSLPANAAGRTDFESQPWPNSTLLQAVKKTACYRSLTFLIMGTIIQFAAGTLFAFPAADLAEYIMGMNMLAMGPELGYTVLAYVVIMAFCLLVMFLFVFICLAFHFRCGKNHEQPAQLSRSTRRVTETVRSKKLYIFAWCVLILVLLVLEAVFVIMVVFNPKGGHYFAGNGVVKRDLPWAQDLG
ncbi:MAG: hypothetical protein Q9205_004458 [Flavoplaca limonia]